MKFWLWISSSRSVAQELQCCAAAEVGEPTATCGGGISGEDEACCSPPSR